MFDVAHVDKVAGTMTVISSRFPGGAGHCMHRTRVEPDVVIATMNVDKAQEERSQQAVHSDSLLRCLDAPVLDPTAR